MLHIAGNVVSDERGEKTFGHDIRFWISIFDNNNSAYYLICGLAKQHEEPCLTSIAFIHVIGPNVLIESFIYMSMAFIKYSINIGNMGAAMIINISGYLLSRYEDNTGNFIEQFVTQNETWVHHLNPESKM